MNERRPAYFWASIAASVLLFLILTAGIVRDHTFYFTSLDSALMQNGEVWGINSEGKDATVFRVSVDTSIGSILRVPLIENQRIITISDPFVSDGQLHLRKTFYEENGTFTEQQVYWDQSKNKLVECSERPAGAAWNDSDEGRVTEIDPPAGSSMRNKGRVQICVRKDGEIRILDCVRSAPGKTPRRILLALLCSLLLGIVLFVAGNLLTYYRLYPGAWIRMGILVLGMMFLLIPLAERQLSRSLYDYASKYALFHCRDSAYLHTLSIDGPQLRRFISEKDRFSPERMGEIWKYGMNEDSSGTDLQDTVISYEKDQDRRDAWSLYDDYVINEESCIIFKQGPNYRAFYDVQNQEAPWLTKISPVHRKYLERAFSSGTAQSFITVTGKQRYAAAFVPTETEAGQRVLVGTRIPLNGILYLFMRVRFRTIRLFMILTGILLVLLMAGSRIALRPLDSLKTAVRELTAGNLKARVEARGFNELHGLAKVFNLMAERMEKQSEGTDSHRLFYEAFLPASLLRRLSGRSVIGALRPDAVYRGDVCSLVIDPGRTEEEEKSSIYENAVRSAEQFGGHHAGMDGALIKLVFTEKSKSALRAVTDLQQSLIADHKPFAWAGMAFCPVELCVIGNEKRMNVVEQDSSEAESLSGIAAALQIPVILTEGLYLDVIRSTTKLHFRCLGRLSGGDYTSREPLYELLDANTAGAKAAREFSRAAFENGVNAYVSGDYFTARNEMIRVLELDPEDLAARCYILNCDRKEPPTVCQAME